ncbi:MAG: hypothetical protein R6X31_07250 [Anaerolineae bacterium]
MRKQVKREVLWPLIVYVAQIPVLIGCVLGLIPIHPIVIVLPLVVFLNFRLDRRGPRGLGLTVAPPDRSLLPVLIFAVLGFTGRLILLRLEGIPLRCPPLTMATVRPLLKDLAVDVFIIALWEEIVNLVSLILRLSGTSVVEMQASQMPFQLLWLMGEVGLMVLVSRVLVGSSPAMESKPETRLLRPLRGRKDREAVR